MSRRYHTLIWMLLSTVIACAQKLTIRANSQAVVGQRFAVQYELNTSSYQDIHNDGDFTGFNVLYGPSVSTMSSYSNINGRSTSSSSTTFTYTLMPTKAGTFTLPSATATVNGKKVKSGTARVEVLPASGSGGGSSPQTGSTQQPQQPSRGTLHGARRNERLSDSDIYITATANKTQVYEQEAVLITYKLYSLVTVEGLNGEMPQLDGFHTQEIEQSPNKSFKMERVGDQNYGTVVWSEYIVYPQRTGKLTIPPIDFTASIQVMMEDDMDMMEAYFNGGMISHVQRKITAPGIEINVKELPERPANFSGTVGRDFSMTSRLTPREVDANDATTLSLNIKGTGNLQLMSAPTVEWPANFEEYDPKRNNLIDITREGNSGNVEFEYVAVPHHEGKYQVGPVEFCYFDTDKNDYVTLRSDSIELNVAKAAPGTQGEHEIENLGDDIHPIKKGDISVSKPGESIFGSSVQLFWYLGVLMVFIIVMIIFRQQAKANADIVGRRGRGANKAAVRRLRTAAKLMKKGDDEHFYDEVMRALWGYVSDKLNLPVTELNKDNVSEMLSMKEIDDETIREFLNTLSECEFARFAPGDAKDNMEQMYNAACDIIGRIDGKIKKK